MTSFNLRRRVFGLLAFCFIPLWVWLALPSAEAAPRPLSPPWPAFGQVQREGFDQPLGFATNQVIDSAVWTESWSGYALQRSGVSVTPWRMPMVVSNAFKIEPERGAIRFWYRPDYSSSVGNGGLATLLELATTNGTASEVWWTLVVTPDGSEVHLVCQTESGPESCLQTEVNWEAGSWHLLTVGFTPTNSALFLDDQLVALGVGLPPIPNEATAYTSLTIGSAFNGSSPAQGQLEELTVFSGRKRSQQMLGHAFGLSVEWDIDLYYAALSKIAAFGPISTEEIAIRAARAAQRQAEREALALEVFGGGMQMMLLGGESAECVTNGPVYLTNVVVNLITNDGWTVYFDVAGGTNEVSYDLFTTPSLSHTSLWTWLEPARTCETHWFTNQPQGESYYTILTPGADRDADGLYDGWEWKHFGHLNQSPGDDYDADGVNNGDAYSNNTDPNQIKFTLNFASRFVNGNSVAGNVVLTQGVPELMAVLVNDTNFAAAQWQPFQTNIMVNLGTTDGEYVVRVGLAGHAADMERIWHGVTITRDTIAPQLVITNPTTSSTTQPVVQLQGYANEPLAWVRYGLTNAAGLQANLTGYVLHQWLDTNTLTFTTNWFQCYDVALETNTNNLTLRIADLAGNVTTTNVTLTLDYSGDTNAPTLAVTWPEENALVAGANFTLRGQVDDVSASVMIELSGNIYDGSVDRDGRFTVAAIPLLAANNELTLVAADAAGNRRTNTHSVRHSSETLTLTPITPEQLAEPAITLTGTVGVSGQTVWVNGQPADVTGTDWTITLPTPADNVVTFNVQTGASLENPTATLNQALESPPQVSPVGYQERNYSGQSGACGAGWFALADSLRTWSPSDEPFGDLLLPGWQNADMERSLSVHASDPFCWGAYVSSGRRIFKAETQLELRVGGSAATKVMRLIRLTATAAGFSDYWLSGFVLGDVPLPAGQIQLFGQPLTPTTTNAYVGELFINLPAGSTNDLPITVTQADSYTFTVQAEEVRATILADGNRDGVINDADRRTISAANPFRFWINDDTDDGDTEGNDIPGQSDIDHILSDLPMYADYHTATGGSYDGYGVVDGTRDLIDFFPVYLDITNLLTLLPPSETVQYKLRQPNEAVNVVFTELNRANALDYQTDYDPAQAVVTRNTHKVTNTGLELPTDFLAGIAHGTNGVLLVEGRAATIHPLELVVEKNGIPVVTLALPLRIGGVELMFRHLNLNYAASGGNNEVPTRANAPNEPPTNGKNFVFMHGYNVNQESARGWGAEIFKRMYWAGSRARFYAVSWRGYETQIFLGISYNLQTNIVHAFETAPVLANFINNLSGETIIAGHSLGNMLASAAVTRFGGTPTKYFIINGAVAMEAFDPDSMPQVDMVNQHWNDYYLGFPAPDDDFLFASEWYQLFPANDPRSQLTWRGAFTNWGNTTVYNFYSSGEEVMNNITAAHGNDFNIPDAAEFPWGCQEKLKGRMFAEFLGSTVGGWGFNQEALDGYGTWTNDPPEWEGISPAAAHDIPPNQIVTKPFFKKSPADLFSTNSTTAQNFTQQHYYDLLARAIPARTFGIGANPIGNDISGFVSSTDMQSLKTGWTTSREEDTDWRHSDCQDMAYVFTHRLFERIVNLGELK